MLAVALLALVLVCEGLLRITERGCLTIRRYTVFPHSAIPPEDDQWLSDALESRDDSSLNLEELQKRVSLQLRIREILRRMDTNFVGTANTGSSSEEASGLVLSEELKLVESRNSKNAPTLTDASILMKRRREMEQEIKAARAILQERESKENESKQH